jgi:hypothetical protein
LFVPSKEEEDEAKPTKKREFVRSFALFFFVERRGSVLFSPGVSTAEGVFLPKNKNYKLISECHHSILE